MVQFDVKRVQKGTESFMVSFDFAKTPITQIADYIIIAASKHNSSDIHFDPREAGMMVRFRIDGDCQDYTFIPKAYERNLTTRLKILANMNITESRLPQDGAIKGTFGDTYLDMRVSCLPLNEGEKIVIRILDYSRSLQGIETLGFHPDNLTKIKRMMGIPNGIILTTGATGSGKSTTTYSILQGLNKPETNIITVEDPIEMNIEGINQVQVNAEIGMTFAAALRSILRQDPNIILIGEIRDSETAQIAVRASITGHLVLSTIHTNNSLATIERLLDMEVERYLLSTALTGIISQRLGKQLCPECRYQRETTQYEKKVFKKYLYKDVSTVWDANPKGCEKCRKGYHGRIAIHEVLEIDDDIRSALNNEKLEKKDLAKMVYTKKTITMLQDALIKVLEGKTSFEEVYRVIEIENEDDENYQEEVESVVEETAPKEEVVVESNDLLDTPTTTTNDANSVANLMSSYIAPAPTETTEQAEAAENSSSNQTKFQIETSIVENPSSLETPTETEVQQPTTTEQAPAETQVQIPVTTEQVPTETEVQQPTTTEQAPIETQVQIPVTTGQIPAETEVQQPTTTEQTPTETEVQQPTTTEQTPTEAEVQQPTTTEQVPIETQVQIPEIAPEPVVQTTPTETETEEEEPNQSIKASTSILDSNQNIIQESGINDQPLKPEGTGYQIIYDKPVEAEETSPEAETTTTEEETSTNETADETESTSTETENTTTDETQTEEETPTETEETSTDETSNNEETSNDETADEAESTSTETENTTTDETQTEEETPTETETTTTDESSNDETSTTEETSTENASSNHHLQKLGD